ncbi:MAG: class I tRNA ligase family protein, partial [Pyrinomonadaceae bacterium]
RLNRISKKVNDALNRYQFHEAIQSLYHFFWNDFCDWYIELSKAQITLDNTGTDNADRDNACNSARSRLITILERSLRLLHPFMPFITEEIWRRLPAQNRHALRHPAYQGNSSIEPTIMLTAFPQCSEQLIDEKAEQQMDAVIELISRARNIRSEMNIKPAESISLLVASHDETLRQVFSTSIDQIKRLAHASDLFVFRELNAPHASARAALGGGAELAIPLEGLIDFEKERQRLAKEELKLTTESSRLDTQLSNPQFIERAQPTKIEELRARIPDIAARLKMIKQTLEALK